VKPRLFLYFISTLAISHAALADDIARGRAMAQRLCAVCHMNPGQGAATAASGISSFSAIARRPGQSPEAIVKWLRSRPESMPDHGVSLDEAWALAQFIMTQK
jgi:mono/diheme cytochrome c family protein